jgi:hypothetical protein
MFYFKSKGFRVKKSLYFLIVLFVSAFITPISFADNHESGFGSRNQAKDLLTKAVNLVDSNETVAFAMITAGAGGLSLKDLYPFCTSMNGTMVAHRYNSGFDMTNFKTSDGVKVAEVMLKNAKVGKISEISYNLTKTGNPQDKEYKKTTFYTKVGSYVCASGYYNK